MGGAKAFVKDLIRYLEDGDCKIEIGWISKSRYGTMDPIKEKITINLPLFLVKTLIHEVLHDENPHFSEETVIEKTDKMIERMTKTQILRVAEIVIATGVFSDLATENKEDKNQEK